jgi:diacylglycerol kinase (ATP)
MRKFLQAVKNAAQGLWWCVRRGRNFRLQLGAGACAVAGGGWLGLTAGEWTAVIVCIGLVLMAEVFNTALEELANEVSREWCPGIGRAKDLAAGAVLLAAMAAVAVALMIVGSRLW